VNPPQFVLWFPTWAFKFGQFSSNFCRKKHPPPSSQGNLPDLAKVLLGEGEAKATFVPWELFSPVENRWNKSGMSLRIKGNHDQHET